MPTITKTFNYTGTTQVLTIPPGTSSIDVHLWAGAGGGGGGDQAGPGRSGSAGHYVSATSVAITNDDIGRVLKVAVGGGGAGGGSGGNAAGGSNGKSLTGYSGGVGGTSGPRGSSGSGGGGGGATLVTIDGREIAIAGGGGGGGGDGRDGTGSAGSNTNSAVADSPTTLGGNGGNHTGDGGGGGAGGGGDIGGRGGDGASGDRGGGGGAAGLSLTPSGGTQGNGSGRTPAGTGSGFYTSGIAVGGSATGTGGNGKAVIVLNISVQAKYKVSGEWKDVNSIKYKVSGAWKNITAAYYKVSGEWKALFNSGVNFTSTSAGFGDAGGNTGGSSGGSPGSGGGGGGGRVICTWLQNKGMFSADDLAVDTQYSVKYISRKTKIGYWFWAVPLVQYMTKSHDNKSWFGGLVIKVIRVLAQARANELAYAMGKTKKRDALGICTRIIGESFCWIVGAIAQPFVEHKFADWLEIYDPEIR